MGYEYNPKPMKGESKEHFMARCYSGVTQTTDDMPSSERLAICRRLWGKGGK